MPSTRELGLAAGLAFGALVYLTFAGCAGQVGDAGPDARPDEGADAAHGGPDAAPGASPDAEPPPWLDGATLADRTCPEDSFLSYRNFGGGFLAEYCTGCHSADVPANMRHDAPAGVDFNSMDRVRDHAARIYARAADGYATMPPAGGPSAEARELLGEWLACGAPEE